VFLLLLACSTPRVDVTLDTKLAPVVDEGPARADGSARPLARMLIGGSEVDVVADTVVVLADDAEEAAALVGGEVVASMDAETLGIEGLPGAYSVRIEPAEVAPETVAERLDALGLSGEVRVSSAMALASLDRVAALREAGVEAGFDVLFTADTFLDDSSIESATPDVLYGTEAAGWAHFADGNTQDFGVIEAWKALEAAGRLDARVGIAVLDGDFLDADLPEDTRFSGGATLPSLSARHGTKVASALASLPDNGVGAAGVGGPVVRPDLIDAWSFGVELLVGVAPARAAGNRAINISSSVSVDDPWGDILMGWMHPITAGIHGSGLMIVASAGNQGTSTNGKLIVPCELEGVVCVGGLGFDSNQLDPASNRGSGLDLVGPFWVATGDPDGTDAITLSTGTSFSAPFVAGTAALVWAADPSLSSGEVLDIMDRTSRNGRVDVAEAVATALGDVPPGILPPADVSFAACEDGILEANAWDYEGEPLDWTWTSDLDGDFGYSEFAETRHLGPGTHRVSVTVVDAADQAATAELRVTVRNDVPDPTVEMEAQTVCAGAATWLRGTASDCDSATGRLSTGFSWSSQLDGDLGDGTQIYPVLSEGSHRVTLQVTDADGGTGSETVEIDVVACDHLPPTVAVGTPAADITAADLAGMYTGYDEGRGQWYTDLSVSATANDPEGARVTVTWQTDRSDLQDVALLSAASGTVRLYSDNYGSGATHVLRAVASDGSLTASATRSVTVWGFE